MQDQTEPRASKWAFFLGDLLLVGAAGLVYTKSSSPLQGWQAAVIVGGVAAGAFMGVLPFLLEYRILARAAEVAELADVVGQIQKLESLAEQIAGATARWQSVQEGADKVALTAKGLAERMSAEARSFTEFLQRANDNEKATLRLEADKLRRAEGDWVHVVVRMLDHVYALHLGAVRSGQPNLIAQLEHFQHACRDAARRIGLTPFGADPAEPFDTQRHQLLEGEQAPAPGARIAETVATGYTFQGRLLRPALVRLQSAEGNGDGANGNQGDASQSQLPLGNQGPTPTES